MQHVTGSLGGFRGLRAELLVELKKEQPLTSHELAERFGLTPQALRRHLKVLEEDGMVRYERVVRGVGAPVFVYSLTESGESFFPRRYVSMLASALETIRSEHGELSITKVLSREWDSLITDAGPVLEGLPLSERVQLAAELLTARGYMARGEMTAPGRATLRIHNCAMCEIALQFPEACKVEAQQLSKLLGASVARSVHRMDGGSLCAYAITDSINLNDVQKDKDVPSMFGTIVPKEDGLDRRIQEQE